MVSIHQNHWMHTHTLNIIKDLRLAPEDVYYSLIVHVGLQRQKVHITSIIVIRLQRKCSISTTKGFPSPINKQEEGTIPHCPVHLYVHDKVSIPNDRQGSHSKSEQHRVPITIQDTRMHRFSKTHGCSFQSIWLREKRES